MENSPREFLPRDMFTTGNFSGEKVGRGQS